jgi:uncharacterized membrane protein YcjF (UPF0283 family)
MENEMQKPEVKKHNWTKFIEALIGTFTDPNGKGSSSRMTLFACIVSMVFIMISDQWYGRPANREIWSSWTVILITILGLNAAVIQMIDAIGILILRIKGKSVEEPKPEAKP